MSPVTAGMALEIAVARKQLDAVEQQGQNALALIDASAAPSAPTSATPQNVQPGVGTRLNVVA